MEIIKPKRLNRGDLIGVITPSWPITEDDEAQMEKGVQTLKSLGFEVKMSKSAYFRRGYLAGTVEQRLLDLHEMWRDPQVKMILLSQGGTSANHLLDGIDYSLIQKNPKIFSGISDGTTLLHSIHKKTGLITFHGPDLFSTFGVDLNPAIQKNILNTFMGEAIEPLRPDPDWKPVKGSRKRSYEGWQCLREGRASGKLVGGHLDTLIKIGFAGYGLDFSNKILFIEGTESGIPYLDRALNTLRLKGVFNEIAGLIVGWFDQVESDDTYPQTVAEIVEEATRGSSFPIIEIRELGHNVQNYVFPIGCQATLDSQELYISLDEAAVN